MNRTVQHASAPARARNLTAFAGAAALALACTLPAAHAAVISFEGVGNGILAPNTTIVQGQYAFTGLASSPDASEFSAVGGVVNGADPYFCLDFNCPTNNKTNYYAAYFGGSLEVTGADTINAFRVTAFNASLVGPSTGYASSVTGTLRVQGTLADNSVMYQDFALTGGGTSGYSFQHFTTTGAFNSQHFVAVDFFGLTCSGSACAWTSTDGTQFALDDIRTAVPEPSTYLTMALGLLAVCARVRSARRA
jgi:hypothetical protein